MGLFDFFRADQSQATHNQQSVHQDSVQVLNLRSSEISESRLQTLAFGASGAALVLAYVSPNLDFETTMSRLKQAMPSKLCSTMLSQPSSVVW